MSRETDTFARQLEHSVSGLLVKDTSDLAAFGDAITAVLADPALAARLGGAQTVRGRFLLSREVADHLALYAAVFAA